jgi:hypothetical protein
MRKSIKQKHMLRLKLAFVQARSMLLYDFSKVLDNLVMDECQTELIVAYMMACNAHLGMNNPIRNKFATKCRKFFGNKDKSEQFMNIFRKYSNESF